MSGSLNQLSPSFDIEGSILPDPLNAQAVTALSTTEPPSTVSENPLLSGSSRCPFHQGDASTHGMMKPKPPDPAITTFVALSKFVIANDKTAEVKEAFRRRPHLVDDQPGFMRLEVFSPLDHPQEIWLITYWTDAGSFTLWHRSHLYQQAHKGIPKGLKLMPGETEIRCFEYICS
jgi:heme oxygenase (mycobilin-producing)